MPNHPPSFYQHHLIPQGISLANTWLITPGTFAGNYLSAVIANQSLGFSQAFSVIKQAPFNGLGLHLAKESLRSAIKTPLLTDFRPYINTQAHHYGVPLIGDILYAVTTATATEVPCNPFEVAKIHKQNNLPVPRNGWMRGVTTSIARLVPAWFGWTSSLRVTDQALEEQGKNPHNVTYLPIRTTIATLCSMLPVYPITRIRYEQQTQSCATVNRHLPTGIYSWKDALKNIVRAQGYRGIFAGAASKFICDSITTLGALVIAGHGKRDPLWTTDRNVSPPAPSHAERLLQERMEHLYEITRNPPVLPHTSQHYPNTIPLSAAARAQDHRCA